eukprot:PhM_4_TR8402/c1_g1_i1/m.59152
MDVAPKVPPLRLLTTSLKNREAAIRIRTARERPRVNRLDESEFSATSRSDGTGMSSTASSFRAASRKVSRQGSSASMAGGGAREDNFATLVGRHLSVSVVRRRSSLGNSSPPIGDVSQTMPPVVPRPPQPPLTMGGSGAPPRNARKARERKDMSLLTMLPQLSQDVASTSPPNSSARDIAKKGESYAYFMVDHSVPLEQRLTMPQLERLQHAFATETLPAEESEWWREARPIAEGVSMKDFVALVHRIIPNESEAELRRWYLRITSGTLGRVTWQDLSQNILLQGEQQYVEDERQSEFDTHKIHARNYQTAKHMDMISCIVVHPTEGRYYTGGRDGLVKEWDAQSLNFVRVLHNHGHAIVGMCLLRNGERLAITGIDRNIAVMDLASSTVVRIFAGSSFATDETSDTALRSTRDTRRYGLFRHETGRRKAAVVAGPTMKKEQFTAQCRECMTIQHVARVPVTVLMDLTEPAMCVLAVPELGDDVILLGLEDGRLLGYALGLEEGGITMRWDVRPALRPKWARHIHRKAISSMAWNRRTTSIFTASWDHTIQLTELPTGRHIQTFMQKKDVLGIVWCERTQVLVSYTTDRKLYMWSLHRDKPYVVEGHAQQIVAIAHNESADQIVSVAADKAIKVWDARTTKCMQTIGDSQRYFPQDMISAVAYDVQRDQIVAGSVFPFVYVLTKNANSFPAGYAGHRKPPVSLGFNMRSRLLVSMDRTNVFVWDVVTGAKAFDFHAPRQLQNRVPRRQPPTTKKDPSSVAVASATAGVASGSFAHIRSSCFLCDQTGLVTGTSDGLVIAWNYITGHPDSIYVHPTPMEITSVVHAMKLDVAYLYFVAGGMVAQLVHADNTLRLDASHTFPDTHLSVVTTCSSALLAIGSDGGVVYFYNTDLRKPTGSTGKHRQGVDIEGLVYLDTTMDILIAGLSNGDCLVLEVHTRSVLFNFNPLNNIDCNLYSIDVSLDNTKMLVGDSAGRVTVVDITDVRSEGIVHVENTIQCAAEAISAVCFIESIDGFGVTALDCSTAVYRMSGERVGVCGDPAPSPWRTTPVMPDGEDGDAEDAVAERLVMVADVGADNGGPTPPRIKPISIDGRDFLSTLVDDVPQGEALSPPSLFPELPGDRGGAATPSEAVSHATHMSTALAVSVPSVSVACSVDPIHQPPGPHISLENVLDDVSANAEENTSPEESEANPQFFLTEVEQHKPVPPPSIISPKSSSVTMLSSTVSGLSTPPKTGLIVTRDSPKSIRDLLVTQPRTGPNGPQPPSQLTQLELRSLVESVSERVGTFRKTARNGTREGIAEWTTRVSSLIRLRPPLDIQPHQNINPNPKDRHHSNNR